MSVVDFMKMMTTFDDKKPLHERKRNIAYFSGKNAAINAAIAFAADKGDLDDPDLDALAKDIREQVHGEYFLTKLIKKGVAYHIGYLPASIRQRIESLFKEGKITAMFCTSTLIEGVNLPADNLFITNYRSGRPHMSSVEFRNLIGRVGRIKFNLYGNVFFISDGNQVTENEYYNLKKELGIDLPALIPQVYLYYDPQTLKQRGYKLFEHQKMDFLMIFSHKDRIVIEIDGKQHYAEGTTASPKLYSEMVRAHREMSLLGYDVYRFGGYEFMGADADETIKKKVLDNIKQFFVRLFYKYGILREN